MNLELLPHPDHPPGAVKSVSVHLDPGERGLTLVYVVEADAADLVVPEPQKPCRADDLWQATCLELFSRSAGETYHEFNFSPSSRWAAYRFESYRRGREPLPLDGSPMVRSSKEPSGLLVTVSLPFEPPAGARLGLSAIIEERGGRKSYWALAHPAGEPDFHHPDCFRLELPPPVRP